MDNIKPVKDILYNCGKCKVTTINIHRINDIEYIKKHKMKLSSFVRQAIQAHKEGKFDYNYL